MLKRRSKPPDPAWRVQTWRYAGPYANSPRIWSRRDPIHAPDLAAAALRAAMREGTSQLRVDKLERWETPSRRPPFPLTAALFFLTAAALFFSLVFLSILAGKLLIALR